jgi:hypothetical protein
MDPEMLWQLLAPLHAAAVELEQQGHDLEQIAVVLDLDPSAVGPLLRVAHAKLARLDMLEISDAPPARPAEDQS